MPPINEKLYENVKDQAKKKFKRYPSIYASSWIVKRYKDLGGKYTETQKPCDGISRWYKEEWVQVIPFLEKGKKISCGNNNKDGKACRPLVRKDNETPITVTELLKIHSKKTLLTLARKKEKNMSGRLFWKRGVFYD